MKKQKKIITIITFIIIVIIIFAGIFVINNPSEDKDEIKDNGNKTSYVTEPFLWRIEGENPSYLFGSIHLPYSNLLTLPDVVYDAIIECDKIYTETKIDDPEINELYKYYMIDTGETLQDLLPDDIENRLKNILSSRGLNIDDYSLFQVWVVANELQRIDIENPKLNPLLDQYIWSLAEQLEKEVDGLERPIESINVFINLNLSEQINLLEDTITAIEEYDSLGKALTEDIESAYLKGDLEELNDFLYADYDDNNPIDVKIYEDLIINRNINMSDRIADNITLNPEKQFFFTIGVGHYYGDDGILTLLENKGFTITRVEFKTNEACGPGEVSINNRCYYPFR